MNPEQLRELLNALPSDIRNLVDNTSVTLTPEHQEFLDVFGLSPGTYFLSQIIALWNQMLAESPNPEESIAVSNASLLCSFLVSRTLHLANFRSISAHLPPENRRILVEEFFDVVNVVETPIPHLRLPTRVRPSEHNRTVRWIFSGLSLVFLILIVLQIVEIIRSTPTQSPSPTEELK